MKFLRPITLALTVFTVSCGPDSSQKSTAQQPTGARIRSADDWVGEKAKNNGFTKDASGNMVPKTDKRSFYENKSASRYGSKEFSKSEYKAGDFAKKSWWGNKNYAPKAYAGNTDGSRFQTPSDLQGQGAREANNAADIPDNYQTGTYATGNANETGNAPVQKGSNDAIENRRKVFAQPDIIDYREQRSLTVEQSKSILGN